MIAMHCRHRQSVYSLQSFQVPCSHNKVSITRVDVFLIISAVIVSDIAIK